MRTQPNNSSSNTANQSLSSRLPIERRTFVAGLAGGATSFLLSPAAQDAFGKESDTAGAHVQRRTQSEDLFGYLRRVDGKFDLDHYRSLLGAANAYKEGDESLGLAATDKQSRENARKLLEQSRLSDLQSHPVFEDALFEYIQLAVDSRVEKKISNWTLKELRDFLLDSTEAQIKQIMPGLSSDTIACVVKIMTNEQLIAVGAKVFNALPGSQIGARGYLGARVQPNSPTDHPDDIQWQAFDSFAFAVGDVLLGTNPVSSEVESVAAVEAALADILQTFAIEEVLPHCVLAHIDVQAAVEQSQPGSTALWFQSLAGVEDANKTFDISVKKMAQHAASRTGKYGLYFETGQGADATNGHGKGFDMVMHESRKYGFARALTQEVAKAQAQAGRPAMPWVHVNDVAGFIGPEIFASRRQLVRCCLEDIVMGKLHGLTIGLDVCSTLHMDVNLDDLDWCLEQIVPACPAYLMALPTKNDPMLSYLTTAFQDHVRLREMTGLKVSDKMWQFFQSLGVIDVQGKPTRHFGQPTWVYLQYCRAKQDPRSDAEILAEGRAKIAEVRARGVFLAEGHGQHPWDMEPELERRVRHLYADSKQCVWAELPENFAGSLPLAVSVSSQSKDRRSYILHPPEGEVLDAHSMMKIEQLRDAHKGAFDVQIVISDGLDALALTDEGHLSPYLESVRAEFTDAGFKTAPEHILVRGGRVRIGYRIGEILFGALPNDNSHRVMLHVIGERPGSGHHAFSVYIAAPRVATWAKAGATDHNVARVVSGIADTGRHPADAASDTFRIVQRLVQTPS